jgi:UDP-N-acetylglucosamine--N-acetylmuramyl-(pentapeptide) pyrophosphoryl-undecaprenol N-acetylglucosamine transferase
MPPILAARRRGAKTFLHESNTIPGRANRLLSRLVDVAFLGFPEAAKLLKVRQTMITGTPVRSEFHPRDKAECCKALGLDANRPAVLVMGGSQGASGVNELVIRSMPLFAKRVPNWQWFHLAGTNDAEKVHSAYAAAGLNAVVHSFFANMEVALGAADAAVTRSGASSLAEFAAMQVPPVLVPLPTAADNHQFSNARAFEVCGAARVVDQKSVTPEQLLTHLQDLVVAGEERTLMQAALTSWYAPDAAARIASQIIASLPVQVRRIALSSANNVPDDHVARTILTSPAEVAA